MADALRGAKVGNLVPPKSLVVRRRMRAHDAMQDRVTVTYRVALLHPLRRLDGS
jgi:hypothetical protein